MLYERVPKEKPFTTDVFRGQIEYLTSMIESDYSQENNSSSPSWQPKIETGMVFHQQSLHPIHQEIFETDT